MNLLPPAQWRTHPGAFIALWTDSQHAYALFDPGQLIATPLTNNTYPALSPIHPGAAWFERLAHDLNGTTATAATDTRPAIAQNRPTDGSTDWPVFDSPAIDGIHQIAVGPIHAAIIEPGHFRFSVLGEQILKLETRLGYSHKGTLALIRHKSPRLAARFAARISGDSTVAHSLAFAHAAESALGLDIPPRARHLRAVMAELERCANHAGDIGAIAGDAGFAFLDARFAWHREALCAAAQAGFGHRLMMDIIIPGGIAGDIATGGPAAILAALDALQAELPSLLRVFDSCSSLQDRLVGAGAIAPALAAAFNAGGVVGRASGRKFDARLTPGYPPYPSLGLQVPVETDGDIAARIRIRLAELAESARLIRILLHSLPDGQIATAPPSGSGSGLGVAESFRGPVWTWLNIAVGTITDVFIADPSTRLWPLLEPAAMNGIVADFPLINKSINASYSGVDL